MSPGTTDSPTSLARRLVRAGKVTEAEPVVHALIADNFDLPVSRVRINADWTSLNSVNGRVTTADGTQYFFKFHQEEGEEGAVEEYYRSEILQNADLPVDVPLMVSSRPGHQVLIYALRHDRSLAQVCLDIELGSDEESISNIVELQRDLDRKTARVYIESLKPADAQLSSVEAIHQLFHHRLVTPPDLDRLGGRAARFYERARFNVGDRTLGWDELKGMRWRINGIPYMRTLGEVFDESLALLRPSRLGEGGRVVAHGDAHNANVWVEERNGSKRLVLFDPAFAGANVPALIADVKATFHNVFAHPFWLYHPALAAERLHVAASIDGDTLAVTHDWGLSRLREAFLESKIDLVWRPLVAELRRRSMLPDDWERIVRCAFFCCPTLVLNLSPTLPTGRDVGRSHEISLLSFAASLMSGSEPADGSEDLFGRFFAAIAP